MFGSWIVCLFALGISLAFFVESFSLRTMPGSDPGGPALYPRILIVMLVVLLIVMFVRLLRTTDFSAGRTWVRSFVLATGDNITDDVRVARRVTMVMGMSAVYPLVILKIGFVLSTVAFTFALLQMLRQPKIMSFGLSVILAVGTHVLFDEVLNARVVPGEWFDLMRFLGF